MPTPLVVQHYPDDFQTVSYVFTGAAINDPTAILYADRTLVIDSIVVGIHAIAGAGGSLTFRYSLNAVQNGSGTAIAVLLPTAANGTYADGETAVLDGVGYVKHYSTAGVVSNDTGSTQLSTSLNVIPQGYWLAIDPASASAFRGTIQVRYRSRQA
jgi:hypothetical protein